MKHLLVFTIILVNAVLIFAVSSQIGYVSAQLRAAPPPASKNTSPLMPVPQPLNPSIPIYESCASSSKATLQPAPALQHRRQLSPLDQIRIGGFKLISLDGVEVPIRELLTAGQPTLIQFWQTSCEQSHAQITYLNDVAERYRQRGLVMLALTIDDPIQRRNLNVFVRQERIRYPVYFAPPSLYRLMTGGATGTPQTYIFGRDGRIANRLIGWEPKRGRPALEAALESNY